MQTAEKEQPKEIPQTTVELLIKPVEQLLQAKNSRAFQPALSIVQVLSAANLLAFPHKVTFAESAAKLLDVSDDMIPIKVIQILLIMLTKQDVGKYPLANKVRAKCNRSVDPRALSKGVREQKPADKEQHFRGSQGNVFAAVRTICD